MAIQSIKRAAHRPSIPGAPLVDSDVELRLKKIRRDHYELSDQVQQVHNSFQQFQNPTAIGVGVTTLAVVLPIPQPDANYYVGAEFTFLNGGWRIATASKTKTGFTIDWVTAAPLNVDNFIRFLVVD
jgi:hypothetical protein